MIHGPTKPRYVVVICLEVVGFVSFCVGLWRWDWYPFAIATCMGAMSALVIVSGALRDQRHQGDQE